MIQLMNTLKNLFGEGYKSVKGGTDWFVQDYLSEFEDPKWNEYMMQRRSGGTYGNQSHPFKAREFKEDYGPFTNYQAGGKVEKLQNTNKASGMINGLNRNKKVEDILRKHVNSLTATKTKSKNNLNRR